MKATPIVAPIVLGHLLITIPAIALIPLTLFFGLYMFGPRLLPYYVSAGLMLVWQSYTVTVPAWKASLKKIGLPEGEVEDLACRTSFMWPGASSVGLFALHTTAAAVCGLHIGPWLVGRWFAWILPLTGMTSHTRAADYYLRHLELMSIVPALAVGYIISLRFKRLSTWAWLLPTAILVYKLVMFTDVGASVLTSHPASRFSYYFVIEHVMPTFDEFLRGADPTRVAEQMTAVAPFYSGVAYSLGALAAKYRLAEKLRSSVQVESSVEVEGEVAVESPEKHD